MKAEELYKRILEYGVDERGVRDRFLGDVELYKLCFNEFIVEDNFETLRQAITARDYKDAFEAAHALKGLAGNLGVTAFNEALHVLVESLRFESYAHVDEEYAKVVRQHNRLLALAADQDYSDEPEEEHEADSADIELTQERKGRRGSRTSG